MGYKKNHPRDYAEVLGDRAARERRRKARVAPYSHRASEEALADSPGTGIRWMVSSQRSRWDRWPNSVPPKGGAYTFVGTLPHELVKSYQLRRYLSRDLSSTSKSIVAGLTVYNRQIIVYNTSIK